MSDNSAKPLAVIKKLPLTVAENGTAKLGRYVSDSLSSEQPLQILLHSYDQQSLQWQCKPLAMMMRTPSDDKALVTGFLLTQNVIKSLDDIAELNQVEAHLVEVTLKQGCQLNWQQLERIFISHSSCGVCGKAAIKQLAINYPPLAIEQNWLSAEALLEMPLLLKAQQPFFAETGGCHGAAIWHSSKLAFVAEDVGRHNAVDKVIGSAVQEAFDFSRSVLILSGRISFELVQKAVVAKIPVIVAVGAPSDLAVMTAKQFNISLIGFTKENSANLYCDNERIIFSHEVK